MIIATNMTDPSQFRITQLGTTKDKKGQIALANMINRGRKQLGREYFKVVPDEVICNVDI